MSTHLSKSIPPPAPTERPRRWAYTIACGIAWALALVVTTRSGGVLDMSAIRSMPFFGDEGQWIAKAEGYYLLKSGRIDSPFWLGNAIDQPLFVPYVFGLVADLSGYCVHDLPYYYNFEEDETANREKGRVPDEHLLMRCRTASTVAGLIGCLLAAAIVWRLAGPVGGAAAFVLLGANPLYAQSVHRAMSEGFLNLWMFAGWLLSALWLGALIRDKRRRAIMLAVAIGVAGGLAAMTKLTGAVVAIAVLALGVWQAIRLTIRARRNLSYGSRLLAVGTAILAAGLAYAIFLAQSPVTWHYPINGPRGFLDWRKETVLAQQERYPEAAVLGFTHRIATVADGIWHKYGTLAATGGFAATLRLDAWLFVAGLTAIVAVFARSRRFRRPPRPWPDAATALAWTLLIVPPLMLTLPLDWDRYYLPGVVVSCLVQAAAIGFSARRIIRRGATTAS